jgi:hypothetical protein
MLCECNNNPPPQDPGPEASSTHAQSVIVIFFLSQQGLGHCIVRAFTTFRRAPCGDYVSVRDGVCAYEMDLDGLGDRRMWGLGEDGVFYG